MRRIDGMALATFAAVVATAAYAGSDYVAPPESGKPNSNVGAIAQAPPQRPPKIRIKRAPADQQVPPGQMPATGPTAATQPTVRVITAQASPAAAAFERIKSLAGTWQLENAPVATTDGVTEFKSVFRVTSAGRTVEETDFPNSRRENITVYHMDGDGLMLTHYCPLGSQPRMRATRFDEPQRISFIFFDGTNLDPSKDRHCHNVMITFTDPDHFQQDWTFYADGQQQHIKSFNWKRVKD
jgi:hypothetical protein